MGSCCEVLTVDDDRLVRWIVQDCIEEAGYPAHTAENAIEAMVKLKTVPDIHVMVTDMRLPIISGPQLIRKGLSLRPDLKIIILTGFADEMDIPAGYTVLSKPVRPAQLTAAVSLACDGSFY